MVKRAGEGKEVQDQGKAKQELRGHEKTGNGETSQG